MTELERLKALARDT